MGLFVFSDEISELQYMDVVIHTIESLVPETPLTSPNPYATPRQTGPDSDNPTIPETPDHDQGKGKHLHLYFFYSLLEL